MSAAAANIPTGRALACQDEAPSYFDVILLPRPVTQVRVCMTDDIAERYLDLLIHCLVFTSPNQIHNKQLLNMHS